VTPWFVSGSAQQSPRWKIVFYIKNATLIFGIPDATMSSCQLFQRFAANRRLTIFRLAYQMP
jgi:hypothetical protein